jgi:hemerythrin-like metal-binding protein
MSQPVFFKWKSDFELGLPAIDDEHRNFFEIMNRCARAASDGASPVAVEVLLQELGTYATHHFRNEEAALERVGYPELALQRVEHQHFVRELERLRSKDAPGVLAALGLTRDWLLRHVLGTDRRYVAWVQQDRARLAMR